MTRIIKDTIHANGIDIAKYKGDDPTAVIQNWMRGRDVIEFLGLWEKLHNPDFNPIEFEGFKNKAGANAFTMSPKRRIFQRKRRMQKFVQ